MTVELQTLLRDLCAGYKVEPIAVYRRSSGPFQPVVAKDDSELESQLLRGGHLLPLPKEPAALANILETSVSQHIAAGLARHGVTSVIGTERGYPDIEAVGPRDERYAVDIKVAQRSRNRLRTQSRITLYTGNTYFRYPSIRWPGTFRPFQAYEQHLDVIVLYNLTDQRHRVDEVEVIVQEPWRIASTKRSSTTREYIGAVDLIADLRAGKGEFETEKAFYDYWRKFPFKTGKVVEQQLQKALAAKETELASKDRNSPFAAG